ncbi:protein FAM193A isoform X2 [Engraulis encrasicolus]|uniref:protein FAM193A isoform X2 n=1 Tax=Engraulis encrasicolus TaxID=184585 RepID=UPI002FD47B01
MSPTDAKRGAKRRKNKRGGGSSSCTSSICSIASNIQAGSPTTAPTCLPRVPAAPVTGFLTSGGTGNGDVGGLASLKGEVPLNGTPQFSVNADFTGFLQSQTPFTFGLNQRAPNTTGDRCLLCRRERKDSTPLETGVVGQNTTSQPFKAPSDLQLPVWVCPDCRRTVEKDESQPHAAMEESLVVPVGIGGLAQNPTGPGGRLLGSGGAPSLSGPEPSPPLPSDSMCSCEACNERREITAESEQESQQLQNHWSEVRYLVRCIYRQTSTPLADDQDHALDHDKESMKALVDRLCEKDPYQLYQRLEQQAREYVLEMKIRLLKHLAAGSKVVPDVALQSPPQAHHFITLLLEEYSALCQAARTISCFLLTLENEYLQKFQVTWELHNKHLFENLVFSEPSLRSRLPALIEKLRQGTTSHDSYSEDVYGKLLERYQLLDQEMSVVAVEWLECERRIDNYVDEQVSLTKEQRDLKKDREFFLQQIKFMEEQVALREEQRKLKEEFFFKQKKFLEDQVEKGRNAAAGDNNFTDTVRQMLSSRRSLPDCPNCNYRRRCTCDDCSLSHILTCGITDAPTAEKLHLKLPSQAEPPQNYLSQVHPPSVSSGSSGSGSGSSSPITIQHLLLPQDTQATFGSDDDEVPLLSAKFVDIYSMSPYSNSAVVAVINGVHSDVNGGGGGDNNMVHKNESPGGSSSSSSSEGDDGEVAGEHPDQQDEHSSLKEDSPPPSYPHTRVEPMQHPCECHVCNQGNMEPTTLLPGNNRLHASQQQQQQQQFFTDKTPPHPGLHLYPHIHGHLPLHSLPHLPRPLLHPTLYPSPPLSHNKTLPPAPSSNHAGGKPQVFGPNLYSNYFSGPGDWNGPLSCPSLTFENIWDTQVIKNWNPSVLLPDTLSGNMLTPPLSDIPLRSTTNELTAAAVPAPVLAAEGSERKNGAKKKCLHNFQDAFLETKQVVMATSSATSSVSCTATTVQSSNNFLEVASKRPTSLGEVYHHVGHEDHRHPTPLTPQNSPTGQPTLSSAALSVPPTPHLPSMASQPFPKAVAAPPDLIDAHHHQGLCLSAGEHPSNHDDGVCSDPECEEHPCIANRTYEILESQDEDSCSEHSSSTSTSTNQKEGKYCDCCYCEFFGHGGPPAAPTSRNYAEMREKLRLRLTKRKEEQPPKKEELQPEPDVVVADDRKVEDLLQFINSGDNKPASSSKAAKRARHKQKKLEKARLEVEARKREELALKQELLHLRELQQQQQQQQQQLRATRKKKKDKKASEAFVADEDDAASAAAAAGGDTTPSPPPPPAPQPAPQHQNSPQPLRQTAQSVLERSMSSKAMLLHGIMGLGQWDVQPDNVPSAHAHHRSPPSMQSRTPARHNSKSEKARAPSEHLHNGIIRETMENCTPSPPPPPPPPTTTTTAAKAVSTSPRPESINDKAVARRQPSNCRIHGETTKRPAEALKAVCLNGQAPAFDMDSRAKPCVTPQSAPGLQGVERSNDVTVKKQINSVKGGRSSPVPVPASPPEPLVQNGKPPGNESQQPKGKTKKNKKKKSDHGNGSIDDVFLPKDIDLESVEMDETEREVEYFKRFCLDSARQTRQRLSINWSNFSFKKATFAAH